MAMGGGGGDCCAEFDFDFSFAACGKAIHTWIGWDKPSLHSTVVDSEDGRMDELPSHDCGLKPTCICLN